MDGRVVQQTQSEEAVVGCGQTLNCSPHYLVIRKSITAQPESHLSTEELPKCTDTAPWSSIKTWEVQGGAAAVIVSVK